jgi:HlyD family type I secretion membrane fusion protein
MTDAAVSAPELDPNAGAMAREAQSLAGLVGERAITQLIRIGWAVIIGFFVFLGGWAAVAHLDSAASSTGVIEADGDHKVLDNPDGGTVSAILVKEGDLVRPGQVLVKLDPLQASATLAIQTAAVDSLSAEVARLQAEQTGASQITFPESLTSRAADPAVARIMQAQNDLFRAHRDATSGQGGELGAQISQARSMADGYRGQMAAVDQQAEMIQDELAGLKKLYAQGFATKPQVLAIERAAAALAGQKREYQANLDRMRYSQAQLSAQVAQLRRDRISTASEQVQASQAKLADAIQTRAAVQAVLDRTVIRAPVAGYVFGLSVNTIGGSVGRGQKILEIVPKDGVPIAEAHLKPGDGAHVVKGMKVNVRVMSAQGRNLPVLHGVVKSRSADLISDPKTGAAYYNLVVAMDHDEMIRSHVSLDVGTPIQVIVPTGSRTAMAFFFQPLMDSMRHGFKEQ